MNKTMNKTAALLLSALLLTFQVNNSRGESEDSAKYGSWNPEHGVPIQVPKRDPKTEWFETAKLGIFQHWGIWVVDKTDISNGINHTPAPGKITPEKYYSQLPRFSPEKYDPTVWADILVKAGAKYVVITTKHHDGIAMWDTKAPGGVDVVDQGGAKQDLIKPWVAAIRKAGLKVGFYFSDADWAHPDYASKLPQPSQLKAGRDHVTKPLSFGSKDEPERWERFIKFRDLQLDELLTYNPDLWWIDGDWERTVEEWHSKEMGERLVAKNPNVIIGRMGKAEFPGAIKYLTPERVIPIKAPTGLWEVCQTITDYWGYVPNKGVEKDATTMVKFFSEVIGRGGNLLLNIAPGPDGTLPENQVKELLKMGEWIKHNEEAIYPTFGGEGLGFSFHRFYGPTTVAPDGKTLYLFVDGQPNGHIVVRGIVSKLRKAEVLATGEELDFHRQVGNGDMPGSYYINVPKSPDPMMTVVKLSFDEVIELSSK